MENEFLTYFVPTIAVVMALVSPLVLLILIKFVKWVLDLLNYIIDKHYFYKERKAIKEVLRTRWVLRSVSVCPNKDYLQFDYENIDTKDLLSISHNKYEAREMEQTK